MELRWYQAEAVEAVWKHLRTKPGNPVVELPTGAGKSLVIAALVTEAVQKWNGRVLVLQHVKELIEQNAGKLQALCPLIKVGLYSAGLKKRETSAPVVMAGVQSVYDKADQLGRFDLVLIDEAHLVPDSGDGMYRQLIRALQQDNPDLVVIGLTATPYRTGDGELCTPDGILNAVCYRVGVRTLIAQGFLSKLIGRRAWNEIDTSGLHRRGGEFLDSELEERFTAENVVEQACREIVTQCVDRKSVLVFCQTVAHAELVASALTAICIGNDVSAGREVEPALEHFDVGNDTLTSPLLPIVADWLDDNGHPTGELRKFLMRGIELVRVIHGGTPNEDRARWIKQFRAGTLKYLVNVNVLTTGFDAPNVDCVAILRATESPGLFYQIVGRGFRLCEGKENCLVLDFGGNIHRHGPVDDIQPKGKRKGKDGEPITKECPECRAVVAPATRTCVCGYIWPEPERDGPNHEGAADGEPLSKGASEETYPVLGVEYRVHTKKDAAEGAPKTLRVTYKVGLADYVSEWVCVEHPAGGFAHQKAAKWWRQRCLAPMPATAAEAVVYALHGLLAEPTEIVVRKKGKDAFPEIVRHKLSAVPDEPPQCPGCKNGNCVSIVIPSGERHVPGKVACGLCNHQYGFVQQEVVNKYGFYDGSFDEFGILPEALFAAYDRHNDYADPKPGGGFDLLSAVNAESDPDCPF